MKKRNFIDSILNIMQDSDLEKVNRVEVIDQKGRSYVNWNENNKVEMELQDGNRTLKIFIKNKK